MKFIKGKAFKICLAVTLCILIAGAIIFASYMKVINSYQEKVKNTIITDVDIAAIPDGSYIGEYDVGIIYAKVEVLVEAGKIKDIVIIEHRNGRGATAESIVEKIIEKQSINVDAVSGATNSSTVLKKAVEVAVQGERLRDGG
jgi:uncharacterized protein with FMN-binding domain